MIPQSAPYSSQPPDGSANVSRPVQCSTGIGIQRVANVMRTIHVVRKLACKDGGKGRTLDTLWDAVDLLDIAGEVRSGRSVSAEKSGDAAREICGVMLLGDVEGDTTVGVA